MKFQESVDLADPGFATVTLYRASASGVFQFIVKPLDRDTVNILRNVNVGVADKYDQHLLRKEGGIPSGRELVHTKGHLWTDNLAAARKAAVDFAQSMRDAHQKESDHYRTVIDKISLDALDDAIALSEIEEE